MPRLDWFAFYPADYDADTWYLSPMQHFAYFQILKTIFLSGQHVTPPSIPDDDKFLQKLCKPASVAEWSETREVLIDGPRALLRSDGGNLTQKRMSAEIAEAIRRSQHGQTAARARWGASRQGATPETAATVKSGPKSGNGNGSDHLSKRQFAYLASQIRKWRDENGTLLTGSTSEEWERAFQLAFGFDSSFWQSETEFHSAN